MTDEELLRLPNPPDYLNSKDVEKKVRSLAGDLKYAIEECLSKFVAESCYYDAKKSLEGAQDAFDALASLVEDLSVALTAMDDYALLQYGCAFEALERCAPNWRDEIMIEDVQKLA
ncbi:MAG: hypothetical protein U1E51_06845 [Candidatus Binatia bacterium]|nr:hypothetical protein [Candidatus Binatia bacterium]